MDDELHYVDVALSKKDYELAAEARLREKEYYVVATANSMRAPLGKRLTSVRVEMIDSLNRVKL